MSIERIPHILGLLTSAELEIDKLRCSCINCKNFDENAELCKLANIRPPAKVIANGCESFVDGIPF